MSEYDAGSESHVKKRVSKVKRLEEERRREIRTVLSTPEGRHFMWRLLMLLRTFEAASAPDPYVLAQNSSVKDVGTIVLNEVIDASPDALSIMKHEAEEKEDG